MQLARWFALVAVAPALIVLLAVGFVVGDLLGLKDTPSVRVSFVVTAVLSAAIGWMLAQRLAVRHAAWSLPIGVGLALAVWIPTSRPAQFPPLVAAAVVMVWVAVLAAVSVAVGKLARRTALAAALLAMAALAVFVMVLPFIAVRLGMGAVTAPWDSVLAWTPSGLTDDTFDGDVLRLQAAQTAAMVAVLVMAGTSYVLGYVVGLRRPRSRAAVLAIAAVPTAPSA